MKDELKPPGKMDEPQLVKYVKDRCYRSSPLYAEDFSMARKAELYDQNEQWLRRSHTTRDSRYPTQWTRLDFDSNDPNSIPLPVLNEMVALRENESARLGRPEYKPRVRAKGENPGITEKEGAEGAERALQFRLKQMPWDPQEQQLCYNMPVYGGAWIYSYWEQTWMDTIRVPAESVVCTRNPLSGVSTEDGAPVDPHPQAGVGPLGGMDGSAVLGPEPTGIGVTGPDGLAEPTNNQGPTSPEEALEAEAAADIMAPGLESYAGGAPMQPQAPPCDYVDTVANNKLGRSNPGTCPKCGSPTQPYQPSMEEAQGELGKDWPRGDWKVEVLWPYNVFPRDAGIGVDRTDVDEWCYVHGETLDWVAERWPNKVRDPKTGAMLIHPEHPSALMAENPTMGAPFVFRGAQHTDVFRNHAVVYEYFKKPWLEWDEGKMAYVKNRGRRIVVVQNRVCLDTTLMTESLNQPGTWVPRARLEFVPWEPMEGGRRGTVGQSLWGRLFDAQDGINERIAQTRAVNQRGALPWYLQARGRNFETRAADSAVPFRRVLVDIDPSDRQPPLTLMQNETINSGVYQEIEQYVSYGQRAAGQVEVEQGSVPPNVGAATAIAYLKTEAGEKRRPRILRIREALVRAWEHGLQLMSAYYIEDREYSYEDEFSEERWSFIHGKVIAESNPRVDIYPTPDYDQRDLQREQIRDMVQLGILNPSQTPQLNRKIVKTLEPTLDFFLDDDKQEDQAQREWRDFKEYGKVPVIDPSLDDAMTHYQEHGRECFSAWFRGMEEKGGWDSALSVLGVNWEMGLTQIAMQAHFMGTLGSLQTMIYTQWTMMLSEAVGQGWQPPQDPQALDMILQWRAHMEAHKLTVLVQQSGIQAPATGSSPTPESEAEGAGQQNQQNQSGQPEAPGMVQ